MKKLITWDMDGVIADSISVMVKKINQVLDGKKIQHELISFKTFSGWGYTQETIEKYTGDEKLAREIDNLFYVPEFLVKSKLFKGTRIAFKTLELPGLSHEILTSRPAVNQQMTIEWLKNRGLFKYFSKINIKKENEEGRDFKVRIIKSRKALMHFDDDPRIVRLVPQAWLVDRPWNQEAGDLDSRRVRGWKGILEKILNQ